MDFNKIDLEPMKLGWGIVWQGGTVDKSITDFEGPLVCVTMDKGEADEQFIDNKNVYSVLSAWIDDAPNPGFVAQLQRLEPNLREATQI